MLFRSLEFVRNPREHADLAADASRRWGIRAPAPDEPQLVHQTFEYAVLTTALVEAAARHPDWIIVRHEDLCRDAPVGLRELAEHVGLVWTDSADRFVRESDRDGAGFATDRVTSAQPDRWRERLTSADVALVRSVLDDFPLVTLADP